MAGLRSLLRKIRLPFDAGTRSLLGRLRLLFAAFFLLVAVSAGVTYWGLRSQASDALVINLAGRQRMLSQQIALLALSAAEGSQPGVLPDANRAELQRLSDTFSQALSALQYGGQVEYPPGSVAQLPPARDPQAMGQLQRVADLWAPYQAALKTLIETPAASPPSSGALAEIERLSPQLASEMDLAVRLLQASADRRSASLRWVQLLFFAGAVGLLGAGWWVARGGILRPLKRLGLSAQRIGAGDLATAVEPAYLQEFQLLSGTFDSMRARLETSQKELLALNQNLEARIEERTRELEALYDVSREITSRLDLNQVLNSVVDKACRLLQAETAYLCLLDPEKQDLRLQSVSGPATHLLQVSAPVANPFVHSVLSAASDRALDGGHIQAGVGCQHACGIIAAQQRASHLAAPLWVGERVIGALCVASRQPNAFSTEAPLLLTRLANVAAIALENAGLYAHAERMAALEERQRIAAAMHDGLAQMIDSLGMLVDQAGEQIENGASQQAGQTLARARQRVAQASSDVRRSIASLQDNPPPPKDLQRQLSDLLAEFSRSEASQVDWQADLNGSLYILEDDAQQVLGIAREALTNAQRYAQASQVRLSLELSNGQACLTVEDDGCGFDPWVYLNGGSAAGRAAQTSMGYAADAETGPAENTADERQHFGLKILQARAEQLQGKLELSSQPGQGTRLQLVWPVRRRNLPAQQVPR